MKRPSFQFYPGDWTANSNLRRCSHEERGIWVDVLCLLHDQEEYGVVRWPLKEIAHAVGCSFSKLQSLVTKGILKGSDSKLSDPFVYVPRSGRKDGEPVELLAAQVGPIWYSSRMVKDEYIRKNAGASTRFSTKPPQDETPSRSPSRRHGEDQSDGSSSSTSSSTSVISSGEEITHSAYPALKPLKNISFAGWPSLPSPETMAQWLVVRKNKRATNTQHAMDLIRSEIQAADFCDVTAEECIRYAVEKSWCGFQWSWVENELKSTGTLAGATDPFSVGNSIANKIRAQAAALQRARQETHA